MKTSANNQDIAIALRLSVADLSTVNPWVGISRFFLIGGLFLFLIALAWSRDGWADFTAITFLAGWIYAFWLICTHDMTHCTLSGWRWFDTIFSRLIAWPMLWPHGTYADLHQLHHGWNGSDLRDPERVQWTLEEYEQAHPLLRWYVRNQLPIALLVLGGLGLIVKTLANGFRFRHLKSSLKQQLALDIGAMVLIHSIFLFFALSNGFLLRYVCFWVILERAIGIIIQMRDHLEHYGKWGKREDYLLTQLYSCRNLKANCFTQWLMGGLPYHSIHHAFPQIPFSRLPQAFERIQLVLEQYDFPLLSYESGYLQETWFLTTHPTVIGENNDQLPPIVNDAL